MRSRNLANPSVRVGCADRPIAYLIHRYRVVQTRMALELAPHFREGYSALCALAQELADLRSRIRRTLAERHRFKSVLSTRPFANAALGSIDCSSSPETPSFGLSARAR